MPLPRPLGRDAKPKMWYSAWEPEKDQKSVALHKAHAGFGSDEIRSTNTPTPVQTLSWALLWIRCGLCLQSVEPSGHADNWIDNQIGKSGDVIPEGL